MNELRILGAEVSELLETHMFADLAFTCSVPDKDTQSRPQQLPGTPRSDYAAFLSNSIANLKSELVCPLNFITFLSVSANLLQFYSYSLSSLLFWPGDYVFIALSA
jgi:hypothetical protein